jgi:transcriptional adapter 3
MAGSKGKYRARGRPRSGKTDEADSGSEAELSDSLSEGFQNEAYASITAAIPGEDASVDEAALANVEKKLKVLSQGNKKKLSLEERDYNNLDIVLQLLQAERTARGTSGPELKDIAIGVVKEEEEVEDMIPLQSERRPSGEFEKNPKSEFVESQTLPFAALGLFDENADGLPQTGDEYLKKKYAVASYPMRDLKDLLPGEIPDADFTRAKPANQVQFATFASYIEPYFRNYIEEDLSFLNQKTVGIEGSYTRQQISSYIIPPLGPLYTDVWADEDGPNAGYSLSPPPQEDNVTSLLPKGSEEKISEDILESEDISCGPLASRLLSALLREGPEKEEESGAEEESDSTPTKNASTFDQQGWKVSAVKADYNSLEERLKREFRYVGILDINLSLREQRKRRQFSANQRQTDEEDFEIDWMNGTEDDDICVEMRALQKRLKSACKLNQACKRRLVPIVQEQMAYQEYSQILDDLDKQVDQVYLKRLRNPKAKKKKLNSTQPQVNPAVAAAEKSGVRALLEKRTRWIDKVGPVFKPPEIMKRVPQTSIFNDLQIDEDDEEEAGEEEEDMYMV